MPRTQGSRRRWPRRALVLALALVAAAFASSARADEPPSPGDSAVDQYVEVVPTASGPKAPGVTKEQRAPLTPRAKRALDKMPAADAKVLEEIATSPDYGAPPRRARPTPGDVRPPPEQIALGRTLGATAVAAAPVDNARTIGLLAVLAVATIGAAAFALRRSR